MDLKQRTNIKLPTPEFRFQYFLPFILYKQDPKVSVPVMLDLLQKKKKRQNLWPHRDYIPAKSKP